MESKVVAYEPHGHAATQRRLVMNQSDANTASRVFCGNRGRKAHKYYCPECGEAYMGAGREPCVDCESKRKEKPCQK